MEAHIGSIVPTPAEAQRLVQAVPGLTLTLDYKRIVEVMGSTGYRGYVGMEYVWIDWEHCNELDTLSETILLRDYFRGQMK